MHTAFRSAAVAVACAAAALAPASAKSIKKPVSQCQRGLGTWRVTSLGMPWTYDVRSGGAAIVDGGNQMTWACSGNVFTFRNGLGANVQLTLAPDGNHMSGAMTDGMSASAVRTSGPPAATAAAPSEAKSGKRGVAAGGSARQRYCASKWPAYRDETIRIWNNEVADLFEGEMSAAEIEKQHQMFMANCVAGNEPALAGY